MSVVTRSDSVARELLDLWRRHVTPDRRDDKNAFGRFLIACGASFDTGRSGATDWDQVLEEIWFVGTEDLRCEARSTQLDQRTAQCQLTTGHEGDHRHTGEFATLMWQDFKMERETVTESGEEGPATTPPTGEA